MYCQDCGQEIPDHAKTCSLCGRIQTVDGPPQINSGLVPAILVTICCCQPLAIVAIVLAARVSSLCAAGDYAGAESSARAAKVWAFVGVLTSVVLWFLIGFFLLVRSMFMEFE